jgi:hypothetical protein
MQSKRVKRTLSYLLEKLFGIQCCFS